MPNNAAVTPAAGGAQPAQPAAQNTWMGAILRMAFMWAVMQYFKQPAKDAVPAANGTASPGLFSTSSGPNPGGLGHYSPLFRKGAPVDMYVYLSEQPNIESYAKAEDQLIWSEKGVKLATEDSRKFTYVYHPSEVCVRMHTGCLRRACMRACMQTSQIRVENGRGQGLTLATPHASDVRAYASLPGLQAVQHNGSVYLHVLFARGGTPLDSEDPAYDEKLFFGTVHSGCMKGLYKLGRPRMPACSSLLFLSTLQHHAGCCQPVLLLLLLLPPQT